MSFTLNWWAFVFPNAGLTLAAIQMGKVFKSPGINGICSALTIMLVIMWLFTAVAHVRAVVRGTILWPGKDEELFWGSKDGTPLGPIENVRIKEIMCTPVVSELRDPESVEVHYRHAGTSTVPLVAVDYDGLYL